MEDSVTHSGDDVLKSNKMRPRRILKRASLVVGVLATAALLTFGVSATARSWLIDQALHYVVRERFEGMPPRRTAALPVRTVKVGMRDGVALDTDVYLPKGAGPWPVILVRDPYGLAQHLSCTIFVRYGYACVHQDVRGRWGSGGSWYPLVNERDDGVDTIRWILAQPWQNRKLALWGESYLGMVQWAMADQLPPEVKTMVAGVSHGDMYQIVYHNGMFMHGVAGIWSATLFQPPMKSFTAAGEWRKTVPGQFPALGVDKRMFGPAWSAYQDYLQHPERDDPYWRSARYETIRNAHLGVHVPVMVLARNNDFFLPGMFTDFETLPTRSQSVFIFGPGDHGGAPGALKVKRPHSRYFADTLAWFDHFLKDAPRPQNLAPGYSVYVNGSDQWRHYDQWPRQSSSLVLHLDRLSQAHHCDGGMLGAQAVGAQSVSYDYDPRRPVPTRGGSFILSSGVAPIAVQDQRNDLCGRPDVLSFTSQPLAKDIVVSGGGAVTLVVASDRADTAFTVKLSEHFADGRVLNIRDDISTLSLRNGATKRIAYKPGDKVELTFQLIPVAWRLQAGSRLRLDISSSNFPAFNPHPNTDGLWSAASEPVIAHQTLYGGSISLPTDGPGEGSGAIAALAPF